MASAGEQSSLSFAPKAKKPTRKSYMRLKVSTLEPIATLYLSQLCIHTEALFFVRRKFFPVELQAHAPNNVRVQY